VPGAIVQPIPIPIPIPVHDSCNMELGVVSKILLLAILITLIVAFLSLGIAFHYYMRDETMKADKWIGRATLLLIITVAELLAMLITLFLGI